MDIDEEILKLYADTVPDSIPIEGWEVELSYNSELCHLESKSPRSPRYYVLTKEAKEWCDANLNHPYWILGVGPNPLKHTVVFYFTDEDDHMMFKLRWS